MVHESYIRTRYCESDAFGHINNVSFFIYLEQARVDFFIDTDIVDKSEDWSFVVASAQCDYRKQAYVNQKLVVKTSVSHMGRTSIKLKHKIVDQTSEELIAEGEVVLVHFNFTEQSSVPINERVIQKLRDYEDGVDALKKV